MCPFTSTCSLMLGLLYCSTMLFTTVTDYGDQIYEPYKLCCDIHCKAPISYGNTSDKLVSVKKEHLSYLSNKSVTVFAKHVKGNKNIWEATIPVCKKPGYFRRGYINRKDITENIVQCPSPNNWVFAKQLDALDEEYDGIFALDYDKNTCSLNEKDHPYNSSFADSSNDKCFKNEKNLMDIGDVKANIDKSTISETAVKAGDETMVDGGDTMVDTDGNAVVDDSAVVDGGDAMVDNDNTIVENDNTMADGGNTIVDGGDTMVDTGDTMVDGGKTMVDKGNTMVENNDMMVDSGNTVVDGGDTMVDGTENLVDKVATMVNNGNKTANRANMADNGNTMADDGGTMADGGDTMVDGAENLVDKVDTMVNNGNKRANVADNGNTMADDGGTMTDGGDTMVNSGNTVVDSGDTMVDNEVASPNSYKTEKHVPVVNETTDKECTAYDVTESSIAQPSGQLSSILDSKNRDHESLKNLESKIAEASICPTSTSAQYSESYIKPHDEPMLDHPILLADSAPHTKGIFVQLRPSTTPDKLKKRKQKQKVEEDASEDDNTVQFLLPGLAVITFISLTFGILGLYAYNMKKKISHLENYYADKILIQVEESDLLYTELEKLKLGDWDVGSAARTLKEEKEELLEQVNVVEEKWSGEKENTLQQSMGQVLAELEAESESKQIEATKKQLEEELLKTQKRLENLQEENAKILNLLNEKNEKLSLKLGQAIDEQNRSVSAEEIEVLKKCIMQLTDDVEPTDAGVENDSIDYTMIDACMARTSAKLRNLSEEKERMNQEHTRNEESLMLLQNENKSLQEQIDESQNLQESLQNMISESSSLNESLQEEKESLLEEKVSLQEEKESLLEEKKSLQIKFKDSFNLNMSVQEEIKALLEERESLQEKFNESLDLRMSLQEENKALLEEKESLQEKFNESIDFSLSLQEVNEFMQEEKESLQVQFNDSLNLRMSLQEENKSLLEEKESLQEKFNESLELRMSLQKQQEALKEEFEESLSSKQNQIDELNSSNENLQQENTAKEMKVQAISDYYDFKEMQSYRIKNEEELELFKKEIRDSELAERNKLRGDMNELRMLMADVKQKISEQQEKNNVLDRVDESINKFCEDEKKLMVEITELKTRMADMKVLSSPPLPQMQYEYKRPPLLPTPPIPPLPPGYGLHCGPYEMKPPQQSTPNTSPSRGPPMSRIMEPHMPSRQQRPGGSFYPPPTSGPTGPHPPSPMGPPPYSPIGPQAPSMGPSNNPMGPSSQKTSRKPHPSGASSSQSGPVPRSSSPIEVKPAVLRPKSEVQSEPERPYDADTSNTSTDSTELTTDSTTDSSSDDNPPQPSSQVDNKPVVSPPPPQGVNAAKPLPPQGVNSAKPLPPQGVNAAKPLPPQGVNAAKPLPPQYRNSRPPLLPRPYTHVNPFHGPAPAPYDIHQQGIAPAPTNAGQAYNQVFYQ